MLCGWVVKVSMALFAGKTVLQYLGDLINAIVFKKEKERSIFI